MLIAAILLPFGSTYTFNKHVIKHRFCKVCGVKVFYVPRSNPDGFSVNVRCLDGMDPTDFRFTSFDGQNWEDSVEALRELHRNRQ